MTTLPKARALAASTLLAALLAACGGTPEATAPTAAPQVTAAPEATAAPEVTAAPEATAQQPAAEADLAAVKTYLLGKAGELKTHTAQLKGVGDQYYQLAESAGFDYAKLWAEQKDAVVAALEQGRAAWVAASPSYEQIEGIVAGTPALAEYDVILDAGASGEEDPENAAPYDLKLPDGKVLARPGNLFGVTESTLWCTYEPFTAAGVPADWDGDGTVEFGEALPDAQVLKAGADTLDSYVVDLLAAAEAWEPTASDAFTSLVVMVPTMNEYFDSWKNSRFVAGDASSQRDFVAISRLADIQDILSSLQVVHQGVSPLIKSVDAEQDAQIGQRLADLKTFVAGVYEQEQGGKRFTAEEADTLGAEAQDRATAITGQVSQVAAQLNIEIQQ